MLVLALGVGVGVAQADPDAPGRETPATEGSTPSADPAQPPGGEEAGVLPEGEEAHDHGDREHSHPDEGADHEHDCPPTAPDGHSCEGDPQDDFRPNGQKPEDSADRSKRGNFEDRGGRERKRRVRPLNHGGSSDTDGHTTLEQTITGGDPADGFQFLGLGPGEGRIVREDLAEAKSGRANRRVSLAYLGHLTDFQVSDEESPARVEFLDAAASPPFPNTVSGAHRPQEAFVAHGADRAIRQMNNFTGDTPHSSLGSADATTPAGTSNLPDPRMDAALMTGDLADNQQRNETEWVVTLLEGGPLDPNSGVDDFSACPGGVAPADPQLADPRNYAGVQDKDDYPLGFTGNLNQFYDPDDPGGVFSDWPTYTGLMDRGQDPFTAQGLRYPNGDPLPSYVAFGNHDGLAQGNQKTVQAFEAIGVGCIKPLVAVSNLPSFDPSTTPPDISTLGAGELMIVPPDPNRQYVDKAQFKDIHDTGQQADAHGFGLVDPAEESDSSGAAGYYAFDLKPGVRMIGLDTLCEGGLTGPSAAGNIDDPQWQWLIGELDAAQEAGKLIIPFGHHPIRSLTCETLPGQGVPDETPPPCTTDDSHGHDINPGCDRDSRTSTPIHLGTELEELFRSYPNVIAYIAGHTHSQTLSTPDEETAGAGPGDFWGIETASLIDWPPQSRLVEVMDNCDGTLSIFATVLDTSAPSVAPEGDDPQIISRRPANHAAGFDAADLASIGRTLSYNDPQGGPAGEGPGEPEDRNVELLLEDPREESSDVCFAASSPAPPDDDDDGDDGDEGDDTAPVATGSLPFTGLGLIALAILGGGLLLSGVASRLLSRDRG